MSTITFPPLPLSAWQDTRDTLRDYAQVVGHIRRTLTPAQKHWWHASLRTSASGLTTTPIPAGDKVFELLFDLLNRRLHITTSLGSRAAIDLRGQSVKALKDELLASLAKVGIHPPIEPEQFEDNSPRAFDATAVATFWQALIQIDTLLKEFRHGFRRESSPVQLWPHHFDLAVVWFSGRLVPDQDPNDPEYADEQMNFGFSTGDGSIPAPYFYATAYPTPENISAIPLPHGATWHTEGWTGAILPYATLVGGKNAGEKVMEFLTTVHTAGSRAMQPVPA